MRTMTYRSARVPRPPIVDDDLGMTAEPNVCAQERLLCSATLSSAIGGYNRRSLEVRSPLQPAQPLTGY